MLHPGPKQSACLHQDDDQSTFLQQKYVFACPLGNGSTLVWQVTCWEVACVVCPRMGLGRAQRMKNKHILQSRGITRIAVSESLLLSIAGTVTREQELGVGSLTESGGTAQSVSQSVSQSAVGGLNSFYCLSPPQPQLIHCGDDGSPLGAASNA
mmetsp:Transcript_22120/g.72843  ORF Transcript_22120/g.72843 Transcript_22120/m.72843 type:complete len:154 (+) Transcript_22120:1980-2441(+)